MKPKPPPEVAHHQHLRIALSFSNLGLDRIYMVEWILGLRTEWQVFFASIVVGLVGWFGQQFLVSRNSSRITPENPTREVSKGLHAEPIKTEELDELIKSRNYSASDVSDFRDDYLVFLFRLHAEYGDLRPLEENPGWHAFVIDMVDRSALSWDHFFDRGKAQSSVATARASIRRNAQHWKPMILRECLRAHELDGFHNFGWKVSLQLCECLESEVDELTLRTFCTLLLKGDFSASSDYTSGIIEIARIGASGNFQDWFKSCYGGTFEEFQRKKEDERRAWRTS